MAKKRGSLQLMLEENSNEWDIKKRCSSIKKR